MDIVETLRRTAAEGISFPVSPLLVDAAEEIERLRGVNETMVEAISSFYIDMHNAMFSFDKKLDEIKDGE